MPLSLKQIEDVCLYDSASKCCKYLVEDANDSGNFHCLKLSKFKAEADENFYKEQLFGLNLDMESNDNCGGFPITRFITVGYDCP